MARHRISRSRVQLAVAARTECAISRRGMISPSIMALIESPASASLSEMELMSGSLRSPRESDMALSSAAEPAPMRPWIVRKKAGSGGLPIAAKIASWTPPTKAR